ncbi:hypothetical protein [Sinomonas sp. G460-2]
MIVYRPFAPLTVGRGGFWSAIAAMIRALLWGSPVDVEHRQA